MSTVNLTVENLTRDAFAPFGDVIEIEGRTPRIINQGTAERYNDLALVDVCDNGGRPLISIFRAQPAELPVQLRLMERHPIASQAFIPLSTTPYLVAVAEADAQPTPERLRAFVTNGRQGINLRRGTWHHPLLALQQISEFLVVDRGDDGGNYDEVSLENHSVMLDYH
ncbi:MAG: ureidoglycolate lyase [Gammaproteobacteria bacterium]|nr:ureidoglycolate lyase [Gammaproteobacteria bacterium]